jgi:hypothetical protein
MKLIKGIYAIFLMIFSLRMFNPKKEFKNKRIAIIGAADSAFVEKNGTFIDGFDIVIRINKAPHAWNKEKTEFIGSKFTYLFHSFYENNYSGGGPIDWEYFDALGIEKVINPNYSKEGLITHLSYYKRHLLFRKTYMLSKENYRVLSNELDGFVPTIGYSTLAAVLQSACEEIFITGFTFFKTPYAKDYREELEDLEANKKHIEDQGLHNPGMEFEAFKNALKNSPCGNIHFDKELQKLLKTGSL